MDLFKPEGSEEEESGYRYQINPIIKKNPNRHLFPKTTQQQINESIKIIGNDCGINASYERFEKYGAIVKKVYQPKYSLLTCHTARRTFITIALQSGIPVPVIMKYTGHTSYKSIARYFAISAEFMYQQISKFGSRDAQKPFSPMEHSFRSTFY